MTLRSLTTSFSRFFDIRPGDAARIGLMAALLFFLLAANNVIKIVRDSLFLSRFPITQLPYVYLLAALLASAVIGIYSRYTSKHSLSQVILGSHVFVVVNVIIFWFLISFYGFGWVLYGFYMWSAIVGLVAVAQFWTLANGMFNPREGKRLFGILTAAGTVGAMTGGFGANLAVSFLFGTNQLLWLIVFLFASAFGAAWLAVREGERVVAATHREEVLSEEIQACDASGIVGTLRGSRYLQAIAALIFVSVIVSTLIDYQFKAAAKEAYPSAEALAGFFGSYYAWLSIVTMFVQVWLTGRLLMGLGLTPSLLLLPLMLLAGSIGLLVWPGLFAATANRFAEASLRTSVNQSGVQILYLPIPDSIKKRVKVFLDVTVERVADGVAAIIILSYSLLLGGVEVTLLSYFSIGVVLIWIAIVFATQSGYIDALRKSLAYRDTSLETARIDFADKATVEAVLKTLEGTDERSILFGLHLAEKLDSRFVIGRLPRRLLQHASSEVRRRALMLFASAPEPKILAEAFELLASQSAEVQAEAIKTVSIMLKKDAVPVIRPFLESPQPEIRRSAIQCLLQCGDAQTREDAFDAFRNLVMDRGPDGENSRLEAARLMGELDEPEFFGQLSRLITNDSSPKVIREAMAAAARRRDPVVIGEIISRLGRSDTKTSAREALIQYGDMAVKGLRAALFDSRVSSGIRLNIPRTLSKIHAQPAMNALLAGLLEEDRSIRFQAILAIEEMVRRFADLKVDREIIENAIMSDALLYFKRLVIFSTLFGDQEKSLQPRESLLYHALTESMERVTERLMWLVALIYPATDIRRAWTGLRSQDLIQRAHAIELLENLLTGSIKKHVFPLFADDQRDQRLRAALDLLGIDSMSTDYAIRALLEQDDRWLKAATIWEIGIRKLRGFRDIISKLSASDDALLRETASVALQGI